MEVVELVEDVVEMQLVEVEAWAYASKEDSPSSHFLKNNAPVLLMVASGSWKLMDNCWTIYWTDLVQ